MDKYRAICQILQQPQSYYGKFDFNGSIYSLFSAVGRWIAGFNPIWWVSKILRLINLVLFAYHLNRRPGFFEGFFLADDCRPPALGSGPFPWTWQSSSLSVPLYLTAFRSHGQPGPTELTVHIRSCPTSKTDRLWRLNTCSSQPFYCMKCEHIFHQLTLPVRERESLREA